ncbi:RusA family crossover junction endodeoxyribonuclease [Streptomyces xanthophaeus]|uniref:RusA family crossover junction endodeoxyribonuclease n=1 Tax=Streptomyces xanthophaeus TaxID=67385 RepID=UPI00264985E1|nr:RusA family crossover junction endodeoxyribonuclease [Streptomyces xanthophaeus]WKD36553.1 RusA family crossover junction endodeoxyribonuclease [Streptomyces xanthophaeus]
MTLTETPAAGMPILPAAGTSPADLTIVVRNHRPAPQGSKRHVGRGRLIEQSTRVRPWREAVETAVRKAMTIRHAIKHGGVPGGPYDPLDGPLSVEIAFTVRKPASAPKYRLTWPTTRDSGDLDKLLRSTFDALTTSGAIADDSRIVEVTARKMHPGEGLDALDEPGAVIRVWRLTEAAAR